MPRRDFTSYEAFHSINLGFGRNQGNTRTIPLSYPCHIEQKALDPK